MVTWGGVLLFIRILVFLIYDDQPQVTKRQKNRGTIACFMCYLWTDAAKDRDNYKQYYEYYQEQAREQKGNK